MRFSSYHRSSPGPRHENQDACSARPIEGELGLAAGIADGVGGSHGGAFAAQFAVRAFVDALAQNPEQDLEALVRQIDADVRQRGMEDPKLRRMATTLSGCRLLRSTLDGIHVGDSRAFLLRGRGIKQLTDDQTEVNRLYGEGLLSNRDAASYARANVLESAIGFVNCVPQRFSHDLRPEDRVLLTTDGVHGRVNKMTMRDVSCESGSPQLLCDRLIELALNAGTSDNLTVVVISVHAEAE